MTSFVLTFTLLNHVLWIGRSVGMGFLIYFPDERERFGPALYITTTHRVYVIYAQ